MKKVLLTLALAAFAFTANAQFVIGGNFGFQHNGAHDDDFTAGSTASSSLTIMPKVGYQLNDDMQIGLSFGLDYGYNRAYTNPLGDKETYTSNPSSTIEITPFLRYNVAKWRNFTVFCEALVGVSIHPQTTTHTVVAGTDNTVDNGDNWTRFGLNVIPGLNYAITEKISMDIYVNLFGIHAWMQNGDGWTRHDWGFNAEYGAQTINAQLNNFMIGFNYAL